MKFTLFVILAVVCQCAKKSRSHKKCWDGIKEVVEGAQVMMADVYAQNWQQAKQHIIILAPIMIKLSSACNFLPKKSLSNINKIQSAFTKINKDIHADNWSNLVLDAGTIVQLSMKIQTG